MQITTIDLGGFVNCYLLKTTAGFILIDTGVLWKRAELEKGLENAGCKPGNLKLIILTHGDIDHTGNASFLRKKYVTKISIHREDAEMTQNIEKMLVGRKVKTVTLKIKHLQWRLSGLYRKEITEFERFKPDVYLEEGQDLKEYAFDAKILHIPGHTNGSIGILTGDGNFFSGDMLVEFKNKPCFALIISDEADLAASIARMKKLNIKMVYPGHGKPLPISSL